MSFDTISVIGLGYIGLPTATMLATKKIKVLGVDSNPSVVDTINSGKVHIVEPNLDNMVQDVVKDGLLKAITFPEQADAFLIAVPTPFQVESTENSPQPDLTHVEKASKDIARVLKKGDLVILESTSPVGTTRRISEWMSEVRDDLTFPHTDFENSDIRIAHCPERVLPGNIINELTDNDRVIGGLTSKCSQ